MLLAFQLANVFFVINFIDALLLCLSAENYVSDVSRVGEREGKEEEEGEKRNK
jgi:hypothetical protein